MIIPIRCVSCNSVIAGKWEPYLEKVKKNRRDMKQGDDMVYLTATTTTTAEGKALDEIGLKKMCCRRHFLAHVDLL
jgi:DNA-directed RNA polymerase I, II, and III subunit RPABC5